MPRFATDRGPLPFAEAFVPNPSRDRLIVFDARNRKAHRNADLRLDKWLYLGIFYSDSTKEGAIRATA